MCCPCVCYSISHRPALSRCRDVVSVPSPFVHIAPTAYPSCPEDLVTHLGLTISLHNMMVNIGISQIYDVSHLEDQRFLYARRRQLAAPESRVPRSGTLSRVFTGTRVGRLRMRVAEQIMVPKLAHRCTSVASLRRVVSENYCSKFSNSNARCR